MRSASTLVMDALKLFFGDFKRYFLIVLVPAVISAASVAVTAMNATDTYTVAPLELFASLVAVVAFLLMGIALTHAVADQTLAPLASYKRSAEQILPYIGYSILLAIIVLVGFILLIIPGIYLAVALSFGVFYLLLERKSITGSLYASHALVKGHWWGVFGRILLLALVTILFSAGISIVAYPLESVLSGTVSAVITDLLSSFTAPVWVIFAYELFKDLKQNARPEQQQAQPEPEAVSSPEAQQ